MSRAPARAGVVGALLVGAFVVWLVVGGRSHGGSSGHPIRYEARLTAAASSVADRYVRAEYAARDCGAMERESAALPGLDVLMAPTSSSLCDVYLQGVRENDSHLVSGSRVLRRECRGGLFGVALQASECLEYTVVGRYVTNDDGTRQRDCNGALVEVFLKRFGGSWKVVAQNDVEDWGGGCGPHDERQWQRRVPWTA